MRFPTSLTTSRLSRRLADLANSTALSRRGLLASMALMGIPEIAAAQDSQTPPTPPASTPTTSSEALEGMPVEPQPDYTLVTKFAVYDLDLLYGVDEDGTPNPGGDRLKLGKFKFMTRSWALDGVLDDNYLGR